MMVEDVLVVGDDVIRAPVKPKRVSFVFGGVWVFVFVCLVLVAFVVGFVVGKGEVMDSGGFFVSNLTNVSLQRGFDAGFVFCKADVVRSINYTIVNCVPLIVNFTGVDEYLLPLSCLNVSK